MLGIAALFLIPITLPLAIIGLIISIITLRKFSKRSRSIVRKKARLGLILNSVALFLGLTVYPLLLYLLFFSGGEATNGVLTITNFEFSTSGEDSFVLTNNGATAITLTKVTFGKQTKKFGEGLDLRMGQARTITGDFGCSNVVMGSEFSERVKVIYRESQSGKTFTFESERNVKGICYP